jgi:hypothetical protein
MSPPTTFARCSAVTGLLLLALSAPVTPSTAAHLPVRRACAVPAHPGEMACLALVRTDVRAPHGVRPQAAPSGLGASDLRSAYALPTGGEGRTVAIVAAYDDPKAEADLAVYRSRYGLPACTTANGCFRKVDQHGGGHLPAADPGWAEEESLDLDMVSAVCPDCHILLLEADRPSMRDLGTAVRTAVALGARYVSNSYGSDERSTDARSDASYFDHPGVAITVASGDDGYGVNYPAASRYVTAVGGTSLTRASNARGWSETAWNGAGSGCSAYVAKPSWQAGTGCTRRSIADVAAVADPDTGVAVYDSYRSGGWLVVGGTSASAPIVAGIYALAGPVAPGSHPSSFPYAHTGALNDVTSGGGSCAPSDLCAARTGYDGPTGLGTPRGVTAFGDGGGR